MTPPRLWVSKRRETRNVPLLFSTYFHKVCRLPNERAETKTNGRERTDIQLCSHLGYRGGISDVDAGAAYTLLNRRWSYLSGRSCCPGKAATGGPSEGGNGGGGGGRGGGGGAAKELLKMSPADGRVCSCDERRRERRAKRGESHGGSHKDTTTRTDQKTHVCQVWTRRQATAAKRQTTLTFGGQGRALRVRLGPVRPKTKKRTTTAVRELLCRPAPQERSEMR
ncbi:uncharacterized protein LOC144205627 [Stigmatopora nigra]